MNINTTVLCRFRTKTNENWHNRLVRTTQSQYGKNKKEPCEMRIGWFKWCLRDRKVKVISILDETKAR